jgi:hypothetical protein
VQIDPQYYPLLIALASLMIVPATIWTARTLWSLWEENRNQRLNCAIDLKLKGYVTSEVLDVKLDALTAHTDELHEQNKLFMDTIRSEGQRREGMILGALEASAKERRQDMTEIRDGLVKVHERVDTILILSGDRRGRGV